MAGPLIGRLSNPPKFLQLRVRFRPGGMAPSLESILLITGTTMIRSFALALAIGAATLTVAQAQDFTAAQRAACKTDYDAFCKGTMPGGGRVLACLEKHNDKLSAACKKVVVEAKK
jgi:pyruvate carboxylase